MKKEIFRADILPFSEDIDPASVRSAGNYIVISHLVRSLVRKGPDLEIVGDLAKSWEISADFRTYRFLIDPSAKYSSGQRILVEDLKSTFERTKVMGHAIHFDFAKIQRIESFGNFLTIEFREPQPDFLTYAHHPEFGALHPSDYSQKSAPQFQITSGAYYLELSTTHGTLNLRRNLNFPGFSQGAPDQVCLFSTSDAEKAEALSKDEIDFAIPVATFTAEMKSKLTEDRHEQIRPRIGFTYSLSINPDKIKTKSARNALQTLLTLYSDDFKRADDSWEVANQLYLPIGPSRLMQTEVEEIWSEIKNSVSTAELPKSLIILLQESFIFAEVLLRKTRTAGISVEVETYKTQGEFAEIVRNDRQKFDIIQNNNDYSSWDLLENMAVALNTTRPLILLGHDLESLKIKALFKSAQYSEKEERQKALKALGRALLEDGFVVPLAYYHLFFYSSKKYDTQNWSSLFPEVAFWKIRLR